VVFEFGAAAGIPFSAVFGAQRLGFQQTGVQHLERPKIVAGPVIDAVVYNRVLIEFGAFYRPNRFDIDRFTLGSCIDPQCTMRNIHPHRSFGCSRTKDFDPCRRQRWSAS